MANIADFRDFEAFKACRAFVREIGFLIRSVPLRRNRCLVDQMERARSLFYLTLLKGLNVTETRPKIRTSFKSDSEATQAPTVGRLSENASWKNLKLKTYNL
jgi:hypothetical protein